MTTTEDHADGGGPNQTDMNTPARRNMGQIRPSPLGQIRVTESCVATPKERQQPHGQQQLAHLPKTRIAHNAKLAEHLSSLSDSASEWLLELMPLITVEGDHYTTRLEHWVSEEAYESHDARTTALGNTGFDLHEKLLEYQRYYASL